MGSPGRREEVPQTAKLPRKRFNNATRRAQFVQAAIKVFSEHGFDATTRILANKIGATQSLMFRYFPRKELLIQAVQEELLKRYSTSDWIVRIANRNRTIRERLIEFSTEYMSKVYDKDWIRIYMFSGLADGSFNRIYIASVTEPLLKTIAAEIRHELQPSGRGTSIITQRELEYLWVFHGGIYYQAIRRHIYGLHVDNELLRESIELSVDSLLWGMRKMLGDQHRTV